MLLGIVAAGEASEGSVVMPALGDLNFVAGTYDYSGTSYTAAQVIDQTGWIGASGLAIPGGAGAGAEIILSPLTTRLATCQWTMVLGVELLVTNPRSLLFTESNSGDGFYIQIDFDSEWDCICTDGSATQSPYDLINGISTGIHKMAVTRTDSNVALAVDGNAIVGTATDTTVATLPVIGFPMVNFFLGGWGNYTEEAVRIRSLTLYDPVADASLPALSTP